MNAPLIASLVGIGMVALGAAESQQPAAGPTGFVAGALTFRAQEIAKDFGVGYAVVSGDVNGDKKADILAISGT